mgnify:CR=1 FL=1
MLFVFVYGTAESMHNFYKHLNYPNLKTPFGHKMMRGYKVSCMVLVIDKIFTDNNYVYIAC